MKTITIDSIIQRNEERFISSLIDDELVMMDIQRGNYIKLNKMANIIWEQIKEPVLVGRLIDYLQNRFQVDKDKCRIETLSCLNRMGEQQLIYL